MRLCGLETFNIPEPPAHLEALNPNLHESHVEIRYDDTQLAPQVSLKDVREVSDDARYTYGQWPVVIAERALGQLRQLSKTDPSISKAVERKIK